MVEKLTAAAEEARAQMGLAWAEALVRYDYATMAEYGRVYPGPVEPDAAGQKRVDAITEELEKLQLEMEDETLETDAYNALYDRVDALEEEARDLQEAYSAEDLAQGWRHRILTERFAKRWDARGSNPSWGRPHIC